MKKIIIILLFYCCVEVVMCQTPSKLNLDSAQYKIIKATVDFLATDAKTFGSNKPLCIKCKESDYEALKKYATENKLAGVTDLINDWKKEPIDSTNTRWLQSLIDFRTKIQNKIAGGAKKERQKLATYSLYTSKLDSIVSQISNYQNRVVATEQTPMLGPSEALDTTTENQGKKKSPSVDSELLVWPNILIMSGLILIIVVLLIRNKIYKKKLKKQSINAEKELSSLKNKIESLKWENESLINERSNLETKIKEFEVQHKAEQEKAKQITLNQEQTVDKPNLVIPAKVESNIRFASYADQGNGFSLNSLLIDSSSETIFEITITSSNTASYKISDNSNAQKYALSNAAYFLGTTCNYDTEPTGQQSIYTEKAGELKLQGTKWIIVNPAIIYFR